MHLRWFRAHCLPDTGRGYRGLGWPTFRAKLSEKQCHRARYSPACTTAVHFLGAHIFRSSARERSRNGLHGDRRCRSRSCTGAEDGRSTPLPELAYRNHGFLDSDDGRPLRILAECLEPLYRFNREQIDDTVVFFGSARLEEHGPLVIDAQNLELFQFADDPGAAFKILQGKLPKLQEPVSPSFAKSSTSATVIAPSVEARASSGTR
jgi:hypothetical protein